MSGVESKVALTAIRGMNLATSDIAKATERLATGKRINQAADDPTGNARAVKLSAQISSFEKVKGGLSVAQSELQQLDDSLSQISGFLVEMRSLALLAANESDSSTKDLYKETFSSYVSSINSVITDTKFAGSASGIFSAANTSAVQTGIGGSDQKTLSFSNLAASGGAMSATAAISVTGLTTSNLDAALTAIDQAINAISIEVSKVGSYQNSLQFTSDMVDSNIFNKTVQYREIMDADLAQEATNLAAARIRQDASTAIMAQANSMNRAVADYLLNGTLG